MLEHLASSQQKNSVMSDACRWPDSQDIWSFVNSEEKRSSFCESFMALATWKACSRLPTLPSRLMIRDADQFKELQPALEAGTSSPLRNSGWTDTPLARATSAFSLSMSRLSQPTMESFTSPAAIKKIEGTLVRS